MARVVVRSKGQITIPTDVRRITHLEIGDQLEVEVTDRGILLRPQKGIDSSAVQAWQAQQPAAPHERAAEGAPGRRQVFYREEELFEALDQPETLDTDA